MDNKNRYLYQGLNFKSDFDDIWQVNDLDYINRDSTVKDKSIYSIDCDLSKEMLRSYACDKLYNYYQKNYGNQEALEILSDCSNGALKIHDLHDIDKPYCYAFSMGRMVRDGLPFLNPYNSKPPKTLHDYVQSVIHFVGYACNQLAGAVSLPDFLVYFDWFARKDNYSDSDIHILFKQFVSAMNYEYRGNQSPFTNINIYDNDFLNHLFSDLLYPDATKPDINSIKQLQIIYVDWIVNESKKTIFTFPIHTANFHSDIINGKRQVFDKDFLEYISEKNCETGLFNIYTGSLASMSSCCRLRSDASLLPYQNSFGAGGVSIGSHRVVTMNLPYIALESIQTNIPFKSLVSKYTNKCIKVLKCQKQIIQDNIDCNQLPLYNGYMDLARQFSTVGFIGLYECWKIIGNIDYSIFGKNLLNMINNILSNELEGIYNLEQIPGETAAYELLNKTKKKFPNYENSEDVFSNQYIPLTENVSILDRLNYQGEFDEMVNGGSVAHLNITEPITKDQMKKLIEYAVQKGCIYFAFNMNFAYCPSCQKIHIGKFESCPVCNSKLKNYTRVVGFITPVDNWIDSRKEEYKNRKFYNTNEIVSSI